MNSRLGYYFTVCLLLLTNDSTLTCLLLDKPQTASFPAPDPLHRPHESHPASRLFAFHSRAARLFLLAINGHMGGFIPLFLPPSMPPLPPPHTRPWHGWRRRTCSSSSPPPASPSPRPAPTTTMAPAGRGTGARRPSPGAPSSPGP
jgi:hypothetical protein